MTKLPLKGFPWVLGFLAAAALLVGCGEDQGNPETRKMPTTAQGEAHSKELRMTLQGSESAENVGALMAAQRGYFEDAGLDLWVGSPLEPSRAAAYVAKEIDDFGVTQLPQVVIGKEKNMPIVAVGSVISHPTGAMIWLQGSGIDGIADLRGKTIAVPGVPFQAGFLETALARAGLTLDDVKLKRVAYELVPALAGGQADAIFGGSRNIEGAELEALGEKPVVTPARALGLPDYEELVLIARTDVATEEPQLIHDFVSAVERGTAAAISDPEAALKVIRKALESVPPPDRRLMEAQVEATLPLLSSSSEMSLKRAQELADWMYENDLVQRRWSAEDLLTNEFAEP